VAVFKLIVTGSFNAGKTEFIKQISEIEPITTDKPISEKELKDVKALTTVAMDFGRLTIDEDLILHIYATPGQERFSFIYPILIKNALALIILADSTNENSIKDITNYYTAFYGLKRLPTVIALTKTDKPNKLSDEKINTILQNIPSDVPILKINATNKEDVKKTVLFALEQLAKEQAI